MDLDDQRERLLRDSIPLTRLTFSPLAVQLDRAASHYERNSFVSCFLRAGARLVSLFTSHVVVNISVSTEDTEIEGEKHQCTEECLTEHATGSLNKILEGYGVIYRAKYQTPLVILLLWRIHAYHGFLQLYSSLKRHVPECRITVDDAMRIPLLYSKFYQMSYLPSPELVTIERSF